MKKHKLRIKVKKSKMKIALAGIGHIGLSNAVLLAQNSEVIALDLINKTLDMSNVKSQGWFIGYG